MKEHDDHSSGGKPKAVTDQRLLQRFCIAQDEQSFRELVERYSQLVLGVCSRVLRNEQDAEEAFQATFMVLAAKAASLQADSSLGAWLYRVAHNTAVRAAQRRSRRRSESLTEEVLVIDDVMENVTNAYRQQVLDEELSRLPKKYREPLVLHYLLGKTNKEVAVALGLSERTIEGRQRQGKRLLRRRLVLRKVSLSLAVAAIANSAGTASAASLQPLIETTVQASLAFAASPLAAANPSYPTHLAQKEILAMSPFTTSLASVVAAVALVGVAIGLAGAEAPGPSADPFGSGVPLVLDVATDDSQLFQDTKIVPAASQQKTSKPAPQKFGFVQKSEARRHIEKQLDSKLRVSLQIVDEPIENILAQLAENFGIPIHIDRGALEDAGVSGDTEVTISLHEIKLCSALNLLFKEPELNGLTYIIQDEVLLITSKERANESLGTVVYDLRKLIEPKMGAEAIGKVIQATIELDSWAENGTGEGVWKVLKPEVLVVAQTQKVHRKIEALLSQLQQVKDRGER